jgi:hypothetical protein
MHAPTCASGLFSSYDAFIFLFGSKGSNPAAGGAASITRVEAPNTPIMLKK